MENLLVFCLCRVYLILCDLWSFALVSAYLNSVLLFQIHKFTLTWKDHYQSTQLGILDLSSGSIYRQLELTFGVSSWARSLPMLWDQGPCCWLASELGWASWLRRAIGCALQPSRAISRDLKPPVVRWNSRLCSLARLHLCLYFVIGQGYKLGCAITPGWVGSQAVFWVDGFTSWTIC